MIKEAYCSFEVSKLLKEKGFDGKCRYYYPNDHTQLISYVDCVQSQMFGNDACIAPTHQMAMDYLREQYDLHIIAFPYKVNDKKKWCCQVYKIFNLIGCEKYTNETLDSYEEAVEAAIKYSLENLI